MATEVYRMVALRKNLTVERGEQALFDDIRYFFYITNARTITQERVVRESNERCNQESLIEQLKNGVNAVRMPEHTATICGVADTACPMLRCFNQEPQTVAKLLTTDSGPSKPVARKPAAPKSAARPRAAVAKARENNAR